MSKLYCIVLPASNLCLIDDGRTWWRMRLDADRPLPENEPAPQMHNIAMHEDIVRFEVHDTLPFEKIFVRARQLWQDLTFVSSFMRAFTLSFPVKLRHLFLVNACRMEPRPIVVKTLLDLMTQPENIQSAETPSSVFRNMNPSVSALVEKIRKKREAFMQKTTS